MKFISFINQLPKQDDPAINEFIELAKQDDTFPDTDDVDILAEYLYLNLNHRLTTAFQKTLMLWFYVRNNYKQPDDNALDKINRIVALQNNDPNYQKV